MDLNGKVALVTGAGGAIGRATLRKLAARGAKIVAVDHDADTLRDAVRELPASASASAIVANVTREEDVARYVGRTVDEAKRIDIFFNNAGIEGPIVRLTDYPLDEFKRVLDVNVVGVFLGMKHVLPVLFKQESGSIINTASIAGLMGSASLSAYVASKHAVIGLTRSAAVECEGTPVRVNCICPGLIDSRMLSAIFEGRAPGHHDAAAEKAITRLPLRRLGTPDDVAGLVAFLGSDDARYISGAAYTVDGGRMAG